MSLPYLQTITKRGCRPRSSRARGRDYGRASEFEIFPSSKISPNFQGATHHGVPPTVSHRSVVLHAYRLQHEFDPVTTVFHPPAERAHSNSQEELLVQEPLVTFLTGERNSNGSVSGKNSNASSGTAITSETLQDACSIFGSFLEEHEYWVDEEQIEGAIPVELLGTFFRNGPGLQVDRPGHQRHTFDGDGMVLSMAFKEGKAFFRNRYVRTQGFVDEQEAGRPLYRNTFSKGSADGGRWFNPLDLKFKNVANTGVIFWAGKLLALWEAGRPHLMDATTLSTLERESNLGGCIGNVLAGHYRVTTEYTEPAKVLHQPVTKHSSRQSSSVNTNNSSRHSYNSSSIDEDDSPDELSSSSQNHNGSFQNNATSNSIGRMKKGRSSSSAHASSLTPSTERTHSSKRWVTFGTGASLVGCSITFYEFLEDGTRIHASTHPLNGIDLSFVHDMAVTEHYYVVLLGPLQFNVGTFVTRYAIGNCTIADCLEYNEAVTSKLFLFPRPGRATAPTDVPVRPHILETIPFYSFHHVNAFETSGGRHVVLDTVAWDHVDLNVNQYTVGEDHYSGGCRSELHRLVCDLSGKGSVSVERVMKRTVEFPAISPLRNGLPNLHSYLVADTVDHELLWGPGQALIKITIPPLIADVNSSSQKHLLANTTPTSANSCTTTAAPSSNASLHMAHTTVATTNHSSSTTITIPPASSQLTTQMWVAGPRHFPGEPTFIPRPNSTREDDGWLLTVLHDAGENLAQVLIFNAEDISAGPVATIRLRHRLPAGFHGYFSGEYLGPDPAAASAHVRQPPNLIRQL